VSRIGKKPIEVPSGVDVKSIDNLITVKGPLGELSKQLSKEMLIEIADNKVEVSRPSDEKSHRSLHGLTRTLLANMITGVTKGFEKKLEIIGVGYRASKQGSKLVLTVGYSHPVEIEPPKGIDIEVPAQTKITVKGIDKEVVGQIAAQIRSVREPEPYKGKGIKYETETIKRKVGKTGAK
jgi:large subunit ribosomal protein L6